MAIIIGIMATFSTFFYKNVNEEIENIDPIIEYTKFNSHFTDEVNHDNIKIKRCFSEGQNNYIIFDNGVQYSFIKANQGVYRNTVKICKGVENCTFTENVRNGKTIVIVNFNGNDYTYTLKD